MQAYFDKFTITMTKKQALSASHVGQCDEDVEELLRDASIRRQLAKISDADLKNTLREYGAWEDDQLLDRQVNERRIIWIAAGDISEGFGNFARVRHGVWFGGVIQ